jgi:hypothetical protein
MKMKASKVLLGMGILSAGFWANSAFGQVRVFILPARATGSHTIVGNEMILDSPGQQIALDIFFSDWDPDETGELLKGYQVVVDGASYTTGIAGALTPYRAPCNTPSDCGNSVAGGGSCSGEGIPANQCHAGFIRISREDFAFRGISNVNGVDQSTLTYRYVGAATADAIQNLKCLGGIEPGKVCIADTDCPGFPDFVPDGTCEINHDDRYAGTIALDVPPDARGTFTISLKDETVQPGSLLLDEFNKPILPQITEFALITIKCQSNADCNDNNACTTDNCNGGGTCSNIPSYNPVTECCDPGSGDVTVINDGNECTDDSCDVDTGVVTHDPEPADTACGDSSETECDGADTCDGAGVCQDNVESAGTACGDSTITECNLADTCDGAGSCDPNFVDAGTFCGDGSTTVCTDPDTCDGAGVCQSNNATDGTECDDGLFCNEGESCIAGVCGGGTPVVCNDDIPCTTDICNEDTNQCDFNLNPGNCLIANVCFLDGTLNPANDCEACDSISAPMDWSFRAAGSDCDDGDSCTGTGRPGIGDDVCDGAGACAGEPDPECNDTCDFAIPAAEGVTLSNNENRGPDDGEASCQPDSNNDIWFAYTAACTGVVFISTTGSAMAPSNDPVLSVFDDCPLNGGMEIACDDDSGVALQAALMLNAVGGTSYRIRVAGFEDNSGDVVLNIATVDDCLIDGVCYEAGEVNPENACEVCTPDVSTVTWTPRPEGSACGSAAETECDNPDACDGAGVCEVNYKPAGTACTDDANECTFDVCGDGLCLHPPRPVDTPCGDPADRECDGPDICDGASACTPNNKAPGTACGDFSVTQCDLADECDGSGFCDDNLAADGTMCDDADVCTGGDVCESGLCAGTSILQAPLVQQEGSRYIRVTAQPPGSPAPIALRLTSPDWPCVLKYIGADGALVNAPVFQLPSAWGTVLVGGTIEISPDSRYDVVAECGSFTSAVGFARTAIYGDIVGSFVGGAWTAPNGIIDAQDFVAIIEAFEHAATAPPLTRSDLWPCTPDGIIDVQDFVRLVDAFQGDPYPCPVPCP